MEFTLTHAISIISISLAIFFYLKNRQIRRIEVISEETIPVLEVNEKIEGLSILYDGSKITQDLYVTKILVKNTGNIDLEFPHKDTSNTPGFIATVLEGAELVDIKAESPGIDSYWFDVSDEGADIAVVYDKLFKTAEIIDIKLITFGKPVLDYSETRIPNVKFLKKNPKSPLLVFQRNQISILSFSFVFAAYFCFLVITEGGLPNPPEHGLEGFTDCEDGFLEIENKSTDKVAYYKLSYETDSGLVVINRGIIEPSELIKMSVSEPESAFHAEYFYENEPTRNAIFRCKDYVRPPSNTLF